MRSGATSHRRMAAAAGLVVLAALLGLLFAVSWPAGLVVVAAGAVTVLAGSEAPRRRTQLALDAGAAPARRPRRRRRRLDIGWATSVIDMGRAGVGSAASRARRRVASAVGAGAGPPGQRGEAVGVVLLSLLLTACAAGFVAYTMVP